MESDRGKRWPHVVLSAASVHTGNWQHGSMAAWQQAVHNPIVASSRDGRFRPLDRRDMRSAHAKRPILNATSRAVVVDCEIALYMRVWEDSREYLATAPALDRSRADAPAALRACLPVAGF
jgi:hypothetical protein